MFLHVVVVVVVVALSLVMLMSRQIKWTEVLLMLGGGRYTTSCLVSGRQLWGRQLWNCGLHVGGGESCVVDVVVVFVVLVVVVCSSDYMYIYEKKNAQCFL
eukprot:GHVS01061917.1.p1 GENE.GHVS01061917.1~~GHVS01061917.1.p1  ORF type:complete len:101 (+),score=17.99 GHVS01061917.1:364-666(+)